MVYQLKFSLLMGRLIYMEFPVPLSFIIIFILFFYLVKMIAHYSYLKLLKLMILIKIIHFLWIQLNIKLNFILKDANQNQIFIASFFVYNLFLLFLRYVIAVIEKSSSSVETKYSLLAK